MCVEKTRAYVKHKTLMNAVVGWGRPVYVGEENAPLLSKAGSSSTPAPAAKKPVAKAAKPAAKVIKIGAKGSGVKTIQELLGIKADGEFGPGTESAVKKFQAKSGLKPNGIVDNATLKALQG
jgi:peptidoglycan hydrolase-like protein with peptidoglycan-binding domain